MRLRMIIAVSLLAVSTAVGLAPQQASASARSAAPPDWAQYHGDAARSGYASSMPTFRGGLHVVRRIRLDGAVYASPIVARGLTIVVTENDTVYAFGPANRLIWQRHLGAPAQQGELPCGNINPLGITGTPVYDAHTGLVYFAAEFTGNPPTHRLFALRTDTGRVAFSRTLDLPGVDNVAMQQRGALALADGRIWVPFGGLAGDCAGYKGRLVGYAENGKGAPRVFTVPTAREGGIWTPPGPSVDRAGNLYVAVGNGASVNPGDPYDYSDSVLKINQFGQRADSFSPNTWRADNFNDADLGSQGPALVGRWVFADGKSGTAYVLRRSHLGGIGGQVHERSLCTSFGGTAVVGSVVFVPCTDGVMAVRIGPAGAMHILWQAPSAVTGSPVVGGGQVWSLDPAGGRLYALGVNYGVQHASIAVGAATRFATPALSGRRILIGTTTGLTVVAY